MNNVPSNYSRVRLRALATELAPVVVSSSELEARLAPLYQRLRIAPGQLEALTGICERRWWEPETPLSWGASQAAQQALRQGEIDADAIEVLIYAGVCREDYEPATACHVAARLKQSGLAISPTAQIYDISNACLGVLNGILDVARRIQLGEIRAGLVVSAESAREINDITIQRMLAAADMPTFVSCLATLTGGSGAVAVLLTDDSWGGGEPPRLLGSAHCNAPEHHQLCRWGTYASKPPTERGDHGDDNVNSKGRDLTLPSSFEQVMNTDSVNVLKHGVELGQRTWQQLMTNVGWRTEQVDRVICHQVGSAHQQTILREIGIAADKDFVTYPFLGNIGTVSLPLTAALAWERGELERGQRVAFLGIGSGLNCMMLGWQW